MRKHYLDHLRAIAILAVITIHVTTKYYAMMATVGQPGWWLANILDSISRFAVPVFAMLSGAVLLGRRESISEFYLKRTARLLPPIIFWTLFYVVFHVYQTGGDGLSSFVKLELFAKGQAAGHLWYLNMFVCLMLFAPFINKFVNGDKPNALDLRRLLTLSFVFFALNSVSSFAKEVLGITMEWFALFPWYIAYFVAGHYLDRYGEVLNISSRRIMVLLAGLVFFGVLLNYCAVVMLGISRDDFAMSNTGPLVFVIALLIFLLARKNAFRLTGHRVVTVISDAAFGIYLIHPVFIYFLSYKLPITGMSPLLVMPIMVVATMLLSCCTIILLRKSAVMRRFC